MELNDSMIELSEDFKSFSTVDELKFGAWELGEVIELNLNIVDAELMRLIEYAGL